MNEPAVNPYERLGGEAALRRLVHRFYELMDTLPDATAIRAMHAEDLTVARDKLFMFLSGWLGGPSLYIERFGHPRLRARHLPFPIDETARDQWLLCMNKALSELVDDNDFRTQLQDAFLRTADHMRNQGAQ